MSQQILVARITCPNCQNQFQVPVEQILDVQADPDAKARLLNGLVNLAVCPNCRMGGSLNLPFLYHDSNKELALVYMPMEAGRDDLQRQQAIGKLTGAVMNSLPPEQRKGYLLQPQVFFTQESLINKVLEADGITQEMLAEQRAKTDLLRRMLEASSDEALETIIKENDAAIDSEFFLVLAANLELAQAMRQVESLQRLLAVRHKLLELSSEGKAVRARSETLEAFRAEPTREKLLDLLIQTDDARTREVLIALGQPLLDYPFFQAFTARIEATLDKDKKKRLEELRSEVLAVRDRLEEATRALFEERAALLRDLLLSEDPEKLARRRFEELDQAFLSVLSINLKDAQAAGDQPAMESLQKIWNLVMGLMEETLPPELRLFNRLMSTEDEAQIEKMLQENRDLVNARLIQFMEQTEAHMREEGSTEAADHLVKVLQKAKDIVK